MATVEGSREFGDEQRALLAERTGIDCVAVIECERTVHHLRVRELV